MGVVKFYEGKTIFITGVTGFMGKVLLEKLLRSCPGIEKIYVLLRPKKGCTIEERLEICLESNIFDVLRKKNPDVLKKIISVKGDINELNLGLSEPDRKILIENVNIIFHSAASVRFDDFLEKSIIMNVRGTREIVQFALDLKKPTMFVHISTAYSSGLQYVEEKLYSPLVDWAEAIKLAEECNKELLYTLTEKYIYPHPNTYTFTKGLAEHVVNDMCAGKIPAIITRPSIVTNTLDEPIAGWNDNFNGPIGIIAAVGKGLLRSSLANDDALTNYIPVDIVIKAIILAAYNSSKEMDKNQIDVYNITESVLNIKAGEFCELGVEIVQNQSPFPNIVWYPRCSQTTCLYNYYVQVLILHMLPAVILDTLLKLTGKKPMVFQLQRKLFIVNCRLKPFMLLNYEFKNDRMINMQKHLKDIDRAFRYRQELNDEQLNKYFIDSKNGICLYVIKESIDPSGQKEMKNLRRFWYADMVLKTIIFSFFSWLLLIRLNLLEKFVAPYYN